jgi:hypothetical protein
LGHAFEDVVAATEVMVEEAGGRVLIGDSSEHPGKYYAIVGSESAHDVAERLTFVR